MVLIKFKQCTKSSVAITIVQLKQFHNINVKRDCFGKFSGWVPTYTNCNL